MFKRDKTGFYVGVDPEDAFLDSTNVPEFNGGLFEGRLIKAISLKEVYIVGIIFALLLLAFGYKLFTLQVLDGESLAKVSQDNMLRRSIIFADRGIITDRFGNELAWNEPQDGAYGTGSTYALRRYRESNGLSHLLGFLNYPEHDKDGNWWRRQFIPRGGIEESYEEQLKGNNGARLVEVNAIGAVLSSSRVDVPVSGNTVKLSIDAEMTEQLYNAVRDGAERSGFGGGAGVVMDVHTGEILAIVSYPEFDLNILTSGEDRAKIAEYTLSESKPFLNRSLQGTYTPGSIIKPFVGAVALQEGVISEHKKLLSTGVLKIPNPYNPGTFSKFHDWSYDLGWLTMRDAIKMSSSIYFYIIGGGFESQPGLGIKKISLWASHFGFGAKTGIALPSESAGIIPNPEWQKEAFGEDAIWRIGNTYHSAIGQYGWLVTPLQAVRYIASVANGGVLHIPKLVQGTEQASVQVPIEDKYLQVVREGMRNGAVSGTAKALNISGIKIAAKTGTAQIGRNNEHMNSWVVGYWPFDYRQGKVTEEPKFAFAIVLEKAPAETLYGAAPAMNPFFKWMVETHGEDYAIGEYPDINPLSASSTIQKEPEDL